MRSTRRGGLQRRPATCCGVRRDAWIAVAVARQQARNSAMSMAGPAGRPERPRSLGGRVVDPCIARGRASDGGRPCLGDSWGLRARGVERPGRGPGGRGVGHHRGRGAAPQTVAGTGIQRMGPRPRSAGLRSARFAGGWSLEEVVELRRVGSGEGVRRWPASSCWGMPSMGGRRTLPWVRRALFALDDWSVRRATASPTHHYEDLNRRLLFAAAALCAVGSVLGLMGVATAVAAVVGAKDGAGTAVRTCRPTRSRS